MEISNGTLYFLSSITIPKTPNNFCRLKFLVLHTFSTKLTDICLNHRGQGGHEKLLLTCSGVSPSSRQCFSHVWTAVVYPWETRANIFSCSFTTFSVGEICVFGRFRTFSDVFGRFHAVNIFVTFFLRQGRKKGRHRWSTTSILFPAVSLDFVRFASKKVDFCAFFSYLKKLILS